MTLPIHVERAHGDTTGVRGFSELRADRGQGGGEVRPWYVYALLEPSETSPSAPISHIVIRCVFISHALLLLVPFVHRFHLSPSRQTCL
jgi:hypothetical protein